MKKIISTTIRKIKRDFKKYGIEGFECKYIYRMEIGSKGGIHIHLLMNELQTDVPMTDTLKIVRKYWTLGSVINKPTYEEGDFQGLAEYLCKEPDASGKAGEEARRIMCPYVPSRNLEKPEKTVKEYKRLLVPKDPEKHPERLECSDGFVIDASSIKRVLNPYNGMSYLKYIELRI